jgi:hypothetical protein
LSLCYERRQLVVVAHWNASLDKHYLGRTFVSCIPPTTIAADFAPAWEVNRSRTGRRRFLRLVGQPAVRDRNGTELILAALEHSKSDFELIVNVRSHLATKGQRSPGEVRLRGPE